MPFCHGVSPVIGGLWDDPIGYPADELIVEPITELLTFADGGHLRKDPCKMLLHPVIHFPETGIIRWFQV